MIKLQTWPIVIDVIYTCKIKVWSTRVHMGYSIPYIITSIRDINKLIPVNIAISLNSFTDDPGLRPKAKHLQDVGRMNTF